MSAKLNLWILENVFHSSLDANNGLVPDYDYDMNYAIEVLEKLDQLARSWGIAETHDKFLDWDCKQFETQYQEWYVLGKFSSGDYPGRPTYWGILANRQMIGGDGDENDVWISKSDTPASAICLAAYFLKTGKTWEEKAV